MCFITLQSAIDDIVSEYITVRRGQDCFETLVDELIHEMNICEDSVEELVLDELLNSLLKESIQECIRVICSEIRRVYILLYTRIQSQ